MTARETVETYIRDAYRQLGGGTVRVADLRIHVPASDDIFRRVLAHMALQDGVHLRGEADQKILTSDDRAAAIMLGGTARHTLLIES